MVFWYCFYAIVYCSMVFWYGLEVWWSVGTGNVYNHFAEPQLLRFCIKIMILQ